MPTLPTTLIENDAGHLSHHNSLHTWYNGFQGLGPVVVCTSLTRPASPYEGLIIYETDTDRKLVYDGASWTVPKNQGLVKMTETRIVGTGTHTITWSGIPNDNTRYNNLMVFWRGGRTLSPGGSGLRIRLNNNSTAGYRYLYASANVGATTPNTAWSNAETDTEIGVIGSTNSMGWFSIANAFTATSRGPTMVGITQWDNGSTFGWRDYVAQGPFGTTPINRIDLYPTESLVNFDNDFYASLYLL